MTNLAPPAVQSKLLPILQRALVQARNLALSGDCTQLYDLADTFEILPELMAHWDDSTLSRIRSILEDYQSSHPNSGYEYLSLLDGNEPVFESNGFGIVAAQGAETGTADK